MPMRHLARRSIPSHRTSFLSQTTYLSTGKDDESKKAPPHQNPSFPAFSFQGLGANRTVKVVVIAALTVVGTIESVFWVKALWANFSPSPSPEETKREGN
jgi:hypothetical protein